MKSIGIICEYNPFHNGHLYHLNKVKEMFPNSTIILVMSGGFMQRGDISVINKWDKTSIALDMGIDLVIELPFVFASQSADVFASGAIQILKKLNVDYLVFGSESGDVNKLSTLVNIQLYNKEYDILVKKYLNLGINYPTAMSKALNDLGGSLVSKPNDILGISYIKAIKVLKANIKPICIKRINDYHSENLENICSATSIRKALKNKIDISNYVPSIVNDYLKQELFFIEKYFGLIKYKIISDINNLNKFQTVDEGIENRIKKCIYTSNNLEELVNNIKTKRYTYNKIRRMLIHILCGFTKEEANRFKDISYIRILGFNHKGREYLNLIKKSIDLPIISNFSSIKDEMLQLEFRVNAVYASILDEEKKNYLISLEYKHKPIIR